MSEARTVRVRILVATSGGEFIGCCMDYGDDKYTWGKIADEIRGYRPPVAYHWIEADVPVPVATTIAGEVTAA